MSDIRNEQHGPVVLIMLDRADRMNPLHFAANDRLVELAAFRPRRHGARGRDDGSGAKVFFAGADSETCTVAFTSRPAPEFRRRSTDGAGFGGITRSLDIGKPIDVVIDGLLWGLRTCAGLRNNGSVLPTRSLPA